MHFNVLNEKSKKLLKKLMEFDLLLFYLNLNYLNKKLIA